MDERERLWCVPERRRTSACPRRRCTSVATADTARAASTGVMELHIVGTLHVIGDQGERRTTVQALRWEA
jgi:hypothetical protein